jgi:hypothetical protein
MVTFPSDGGQAVSHANRHGCTLEYTEAEGMYIGHPEPKHTPTPAITTDEILDYVDMPLDVVTALFLNVAHDAAVGMVWESVR